MKKALLPISASILVAGLLVAVGLQLQSAFNPTIAIVLIFVAGMVGLLLGNFLGRTLRTGMREEEVTHLKHKLEDTTSRTRRAYEEITSHRLLIGSFPKIGRFTLQDVIHILLAHHYVLDGTRTNFEDDLRKMVVEALKEGLQEPVGPEVLGEGRE